MVSVRKVFNCLLIILGSCFLNSCSKSGDMSVSPPAVVHILAPSRATERTDSLAAETALRIAACELAEKYGVRIRYWSADQLQRVPANAYPRVEFKGRGDLSFTDNYLKGTRVRLKRQGNTFSLWAGKAGHESTLIGRRVMDFPNKVYVGFMVNAFYEPKELSAGVRDIKINGTGFVKPQLKDLGPLVKPGTFSDKNGRWTLTTFGYQRKDQNDWRECGAFLYLSQEGDFEMVGSLEPSGASVDPLDMLFGYSGLMCRSGLDADAMEVGVFKKNGNILGGWRNENYPRLNWFGDGTEQEISLVIQEKQDDNRNPFVNKYPKIKVSWATWPALTESVQRLSDRLVGELVQRYHLKPVETSPATRPTGVPAGLTEIREKILSGESNQIWSAAQQVEPLLDKYPGNASVHSLAAMPGAILAGLEVYGFFCDQTQFLVTPLTHLLLAKRAGPRVGVEDRLTEAWVMLVCGYPDSAKNVIDQLPPEVRKNPECRALKMFITRDYTPYSPETIINASSMEQAAWVFSIYACGRNDLLMNAPAKMAMSKINEALLPNYGISDVSTAHQCTTLAIRYALARDIQTFLVLRDLRLADRGAVVGQLAKTFNISGTKNLSILAGKIAVGLTSEAMGYGSNSIEMGDQLSPVLSAMNNLYILAMAKPVEPEALGNGLKWRSLYLHDFTDYRRGLLAHLLYRRANFMAYSWGVPYQAYEFCHQASQGFIKAKDLREFFDLYSLLARNDPKGYEMIDKLGQTPFRNNPAFYFHLTVPYHRGGGMVMNGNIGSRGCWQWCLLYQTQDSPIDVFGDENTAEMVDLGLKVDPYSFTLAKYLLNRSVTLRPMDEMIVKMPYHLALLQMTAKRANALNLRSEAIKYYEKVIDMAPRQDKSYSALVRLYTQNGQRTKAIDLVKKAAGCVPNTVGMSNMLGDAACWLVDENRPLEALDLGRRGAESYSCAGLHGFAVALEANGRTEDALKVYRSIAERYEGEAWELIDYLFRQHASDLEITGEIKQLLASHPTMKQTVANSILEGFCTLGDHLALLETLLKTDLAVVKPEKQMTFLLLTSLYSRHFDKVMVYAEKAAAKGQLEPYELLAVHTAILLSGRTEDRRQFQGALGNYPAGAWLYPHIQYLLGRLTAKELESRCNNELDRAYAFWLIGVQAESRKDYPEALKAYGKAAKCETTYLPRRLGQYWPQTLHSERNAVK
jgi:tetratricopeptide (TPR) repeat protein